MWRRVVVLAFLVDALVAACSDFTAATPPPGGQDGGADGVPPPDETPPGAGDGSTGSLVPLVERPAPNAVGRRMTVVGSRLLWLWDEGGRSTISAARFSVAQDGGPSVDPVHTAIATPGIGIRQFSGDVRAAAAVYQAANATAVVFDDRLEPSAATGTLPLCAGDSGDTRRGDAYCRGEGQGASLYRWKGGAQVSVAATGLPAGGDFAVVTTNNTNDFLAFYSALDEGKIYELDLPKLDGGAIPATLFAEGQLGPSRVFALGSNVYWTTTGSSGETLETKARGGTGVVRLASRPKIAAYVVSGSEGVLLAVPSADTPDQATLERVRAGAEATVIASSIPTPVDMVVAQRFLLWITKDARIYAMPLR